MKWGTRCGAVALFICATGCAGEQHATGSSADATPRAADCPIMQKAKRPLPHVTPERETLEYWIERSRLDGDPDEVLVTARDIRVHNLALRTADDGQPLGQIDMREAVDTEALLRQVNERLAYMADRVSSGVYLDKRGEILDDATLALLNQVPTLPATAPQWQVATGLISLRCGPLKQGLYTKALDLDFERNTCSTIRPNELFQLLGRWSENFWLVRTPYAMGWISTDAPMEEPDAARLEELLGPAARELSRRALLEEAFSFLHEPYGWAGRGGGHDCSRFLLDVFSSFGLELPRHSARQALAGTFFIDVSALGNNKEKQLLIEAAARRGIVLLQLPGHIMLYLGKTEGGVPMVMHAFSEFLTTCPGGEGEIVNRTDEIEISDLSLGSGTSRRDFLSRITRIAVIGKGPGPELAGSATLRLAARPSFPVGGRCKDSRSAALFTSPRRPNREQPLVVIATASHDTGSAQLALQDPEGTLHLPTVHRLGGPPFTQWARVPSPQAGRWTAVLADGDRTLACESIKVNRTPVRRAKRTEPGPAWTPAWRWEEDTENLYSAFVEQLFADPPREGETWPDLQTLTRDRERNLLYDYRSSGEDAKLLLRPDCADLPYFLRAYFAWKLRLPVGYRSCTRGTRDGPPVCEETLFTNLDLVEALDEVAVANTFFRRVAGTVHSASARTLPDAEWTDVYPVQLTRKALRPGTVFADPYGHLLVVAKWQPQTVDGYGLMLGADAQPDGTVGRRRFWRGSFLFSPETELVGAGFKAWRPLRFDREQGVLVPSENKALKWTKRAPRWSLEQYNASADRFYQRMEELINPRPLDPVQMQVRLVDALEEVIARRVVSVDNGEAFVRGRPGQPIDMPNRYRVFETIGPWEDYSTPSRDMRLLISMDAVLGFSNQVRDNPEQYGFSANAADQGVAQVRATLDAELKRRTFSYTRSDGTAQELSLHDVVTRAPDFEMAYNPNDCIEIRWAAPESSPESATCNRRAPAAQQTRMRKYRSWFAARKRPPR